MIEKAVNPRFEDYLFNWNETYQFLVGGYGSSKSYHTALKIILKLLREKRTALVVREVFDTHRDSTFALFEDIIGELELGHAVKAVSSPMQLRFSNGSRIMFKGMDNPAKLKSIHHISLIWIEECSEVKYEGFKELIGRLRHPELSLHMICTTNPVGTSNWTYRHFFRDDQKNGSYWMIRRCMKKAPSLREIRITTIPQRAIICFCRKAILSSWTAYGITIPIYTGSPAKDSSALTASACFRSFRSWSTTK